MKLSRNDPDPHHVKDVVNAQVPNNLQTVRSFLGMVNYCSRYIKDFAKIGRFHNYVICVHDRNATGSSS